MTTQQHNTNRSTALATRSTALAALGQALGTGLKIWDSSTQASLKSWRFAAHNTEAWLEASAFPSAEAVLRMNRTLAHSLAGALLGKEPWDTVVGDAANRTRAASRYRRLVYTLGKQAFGSATFEGETELATDEFFKLLYLPPNGEACGTALFHVGGNIPYGDGIFRLTPDYNFYDRFLERGMAVYAMELCGDRYTHGYSQLTMDKLVASTRRLSEVAFEHNGKRKMVMEGYCGQGTQALVYLTGEPEDADRKFRAFCSFVAPIDGTRCPRLADPVTLAPELVSGAQLALWQALGGYVPGDKLRNGLDLALKANFYKSPLGYFSTGWEQGNLAQVNRLEDLNTKQIRDLAGAYWISPDAARRFPVTVDVSRYTTALFRDGVKRDGTLPWAYRGEQLTLGTIRDKTSIQMFGFFGGQDDVIYDRTAHVLVSLLGDRYTHVVHPDAGHITYVLSPKVWNPQHPNALRPNPIDILTAGEET